MILQTIKQREGEFDKEFFSVETELGTDIPIYNRLPAIKSFHRATIIAILKAEIEWLKGEKEKGMDPAYNGHYHGGYQFALNQTITHLEKIIKTLEV